MAPVVRPLVVDDLPVLDALEKRAQPVPWSEDQLLLELVNDGGVVLGAIDDGALLGHICVRKILDELWVLNLAVDPDHRRHGLARRLLDAGIVRGRAVGCLSLWLEVRDSNVAARTLYEAYGLAERGRRPRYYPPVPPSTERETAVLMSVSLVR